MKIKASSVRLKAGPADGLEEGQFEAYASVFGNRDSYGDVVLPGAFATTLKEWAESGSNLPLLFGHNMSDPDYNIGHVLTATEDDHGLLVRAQLDLESPKGAQVYRLLKGKRINQMSFAYDVVEGAWVTKDDDEHYELRELKLYEVSVVTIGANQETEILAVKTATDVLAGNLKEGRVLAAKHIDSLRAAQDAIGTVIAAAEATTDQEKASGTRPANDEHGTAVKSEEPPAGPPARTLARQALELELSAL